VGILHTPAHAARAENCRRTWLAHAPRQAIDYVFLVGNAAEFRREGDVLYLPCPDDYPSLPQKTRRFCQWALEHAAFDYLFKCDDDTYVDLAKLADYPAGRSFDYAGCEYAGYASGGGGYLLSRRAAAVVRDHLEAPTGNEDELVGRCLRAHGIALCADPAFQGFTRWTGLEPDQDNTVITAHGIPGERWEAIHRRLTDPGPLRIWVPTSNRYVAAAAVCLRLLDRFWPDHPPVDVTHGELRPELPDAAPQRFRAIGLGPDAEQSWVERALVYLTEHNADELVLLALDDYALFQPVDARAVALACRAMRQAPRIAGFALTWQPPDPAGPYRDRHDMVVFPHWDYTVNLQAAVWRRQTLVEILRLCPPKIGMWELEQAASRMFRQRMPGHIMAGWNIPRPADASGFVDGTTKTGWVFAYHNLMHQGAPDPRHAEFLRRQDRESWRG
ncbi:MAG: hypothetical protein NUV77_23090, partial [Thermoguttaceae bacterium]|nr:hypothetical protein [Thermoguttaceae bacterium]